MSTVHRARPIAAASLSLVLILAACAGQTPQTTPSGSPAPASPSAVTSPPVAASATPGEATASAGSVATPTLPAETSGPTPGPASPTPEPAPTPVDYGATGRGVTVVIIDRGIDWRNPDFINEDGTTRIRYMLDMSGQSWCTDPKPRPVEYDADDINAALRGERELDFRDAVGHGTSTAGLAAGNGRALDSRLYQGVAPEADLVIVKATSEGAAARGDIPAEAAFNACIDDAIDWAAQKADELGQPAVATWNAGTQWGPIDGTSAISRKINDVFGPDQPGRLWVTPAGDEGGVPNHAGADYSAGSPAEITFQVTGDRANPTAWYSGDGPATVTIELSDGTRLGPVDPADFAQADGITITQYRPGEEFYPWTSTSGDRAVWMMIEGHRGKGGTITFAPAGGSGGHVDVYGDLTGPTPLSSSIEFTSSLVPGRISSVGATRDVIVVGVHVALDSFEAMDGRMVDFSDSGRTGELWHGSPGGPTRDGRNPIDVTAGGQNLPASVAADSTWSTLPGLQPRDGEGLYIRFGGTSAAAPIVVGAVALMFEVNPSLTTEDVRQILHDTAISDEFTGEVPNAGWGYGKIDIAAAVEAARAAAP